MLKKTFLLCVAVILMMVVWNRGFAAIFSTNDLEGTWYVHQVVSGDAPNGDPRWGYGILDIDSTGSVTGTFTSSYGTESTSATVQIDSAGNFNIIGTSPFYGTMNDDKNLMVWIDGSDGSEGNALMVAIKHDSATTFSTNDLEGTWYVHQVVSGDAPNDDPRWGYGILDIDSTGSVTGTFTNSYGTESTSATVQIDSAGNFNIIGTSPFYGTMNDNKNLMVWIDGSDGSAGNALVVGIKKSKTNGDDSNGGGGGCFITTLFENN